MDETQTTAILRYSRGDVGQHLIQRGHRLRVGSPSVVGTVTGEKRPVIINDTFSQHGGDTLAALPNPLLPDTRAEMGLPLLISDELLGVLDIQSREPDRFLPQDLPAFQLIADQLAIAIYNARLQALAEARYEQISRLNQQMMREAWQNGDTRALLREVYGTPASPDSRATLSVPLQIRGQVVGTLEAALPDATFTEGENVILQAVAERVSLAMENARLFQETQNSLAETSALYQLSQQLNETSTLDDVLNAIIVSLAPDATGGQIWVFDEVLPDEVPQQATLVAGVEMLLDEPVSSQTGTMLRLDDYPFLAALPPDRPLFVADTRQAPAPALAQLFGSAAHSLALIPLTIRSVRKGFIVLAFEERTFGDRDRRLYSALIGQAGVAIDNRLLLRQKDDALTRNEKLYAASRIINTSASLEDLVYAAVATSASPEFNFWLALLEGTPDDGGWPARARLIARSSAGGVARVDEEHRVFLPADSPMRRREPYLLRETGEDTPPQRWLRSLGQQFMAIFPLFSDNTPIALFYIVAAVPAELSPDDFEVYRALTGQMSTQIQNRRLLERTEEALSETRRLYIASSAIATAPDTSSIYEALAAHLLVPLLQRTRQPLTLSLSLLLARPEPVINAPLLEYAYQWTSDNTLSIVPTGQHIPHEETPFGRLTEAADEGVLLYRNIRGEVPADDAPRLLHLLHQGHATSAAVAPLRARQRWLGVIIVRSSRPAFFDENYGRFMMAFAGQVATALERQQLLIQSETERSNLNSILSTLPAGVLVLDPQTLIPVQINERVQDLLGQPIDYTLPFTAAHYNMYRTGTNLFYPDDDLPIYTARDQDRPMFCDDVAIIINGHHHSDLLLNAAPIYDTRGQMLAIVTAFQDISNLRSLENTLQENLRETVSMYETQRSLTQSSTLEDMLDNILVQISVQQPGDPCIIMTQISDNTPYLARTMGLELEPVTALAPLLLEDASRFNDVATATMDETARSLLLAQGVAALLIIPLRSRNRPLPLGWLLMAAGTAGAFSPEHERVLTTLSEMASTAIDNNYLVQSTRVALRDTAALYNATAAISRSRDLSELALALETALNSLQPDVAAGFLLVSGSGNRSGVFNELFNHGFDEAEITALDFRRIAVEELPQLDRLCIITRDDVPASPLADELLKTDQLHTLALVNLRVKEQPAGRLLVGYRRPYRLTQGEQNFLNALADGASVVIDNQLLFQQIDSTLQETSVLYQASRALIEVSEPAEIINVIVTYLIEPHINQVFIARLNTSSWDSPGAAAAIVATWQAEDVVDLSGVDLTPDQFPAWRQLTTDHLLIIDDIYDASSGLDPLEQTSIESLDTRSLVVIPLRVASRDIGAIWLGSREPFTYNDQHQRIYQAFAEQTSLSLEAARLLEQTERRARQLETSAVISQSIGTILDLDVLLPQMVDLIRDQFGYDHVQVFLMDDSDYAVLRASTGEAGRKLLAINHKLKRGSESVIGRVTTVGVPTLALDTADAGVVHKPNIYLPLTRSEMALPLIVKGEIVGALDVQSNQPNAFTEEDIQVLTSLAAQIAVAIDNAGLYEDSLRRANEMSFLFEVTNAATASTSMDDALQTIAQRLTDNLNALVCVIYLPATYEDFEHNRQVRLLPTAGSGIDGPLSDIAEVRAGDGENLIGIVASSLQPVLVNDVSREVRYVPIRPEARSGIIIPINSGPELIGLLALESARTAAFDHNALTLLLTLMGSVAATIQNRLLVDKLQKSNEQLREVDRLKGQFLASMSHELRTPLNSIIGFSRVMLRGIDGPLTEMQEQDLTTIYNSGNHLLNLINDILDQAKIEANELNLKFEYFEVKPMIESVKSIAVGLIKEKALQLMVEVAPNLPRAYGDEFRSRQILLNLVSNAIKFTPQGSVSLRAYGSTDRRGRPVIQVDVTDTGIGISEKDMTKLFERFRQVDSSLTRTVGGTGLGLAISKSLAELQGGSITVHSEVNIGSTFSVTIPLEPVAEAGRREVRDSDPPPAAPPPPTGSDTAIRKKPTTAEIAAAGGEAARPRPGTLTREMPALPAKRDVLLIEDNKEMVDQYRRALQREGFEVQTADHPAYARAMVGQIRPRVVLMDVNFGHGQGWEILKDLKEQDETFDIPIVVCSLSSETERMYRLGAHTFLQRPVSPNDLVEAILKAEKESQRERILIIDDQPESVRLLTQVLDEHGNYRVFSADNGTEGIALVARRRPDLIILDLRMPDKDGFSVLLELRNNPETARIPVLVVTGDPHLSDDEQTALQNVRVVPKTGISQAAFEQFIHDVQTHLSGGENPA
ncbi:MAG: GAF domain-containing protein [Anaerolineae bacterium]|nr:GAF domain-containing protein [Anaerolineae bacterium]